MKIAFIYDAVYPFVTGGAEKRVYELAKMLAKRGHNVHWYGIGWWWPEKGKKDIEMDGIKLHGVCKPIDLYNEERRSIKEAFLFALRLLPVLMQENYDIVDCQGFPFFSCFTAKIHALIGKSTLIITLHEVWNDYWYQYLGKMGFFGKWIEKITVHLSDKIITVSKKTKKDLKEILPSEKSVVIPNGINFGDIARINPAIQKSDIIYAGRLISDKNVHILIEAVALLDDENFKCLIIGDGPEKDSLMKLSKKLGIQDMIIFKGFLKDHDELIGYMKSSGVFVLPSRREGFGMVVIEANACGLPVIVVKNKMNAATELVVNSMNGYICETSPEDIADKIRESLEKKEAMEQDCIQMSKKYAWEKIVDSLEKFYSDALK